MKLLANRARLLGGAALGLGMAMAAAQPAEADSICVFAPPVTPGIGVGADCTDANGNGHTEVIFDVGGLGLNLGSPNAVLTYIGSGDFGLTTGYIESTTAGKSVIRITTDQAFTYVGTGSTLVGQATATGATTLSLTGASVTLNSGNITANGAGSTALSVIANGGAGSGGINGNIDGDILSADGPAIVLNSTNAAGTGDILLTSTTGNTINSGGSDAVSIFSAGSGAITVNLADSVTASGGHGIKISNTAIGGDISLTTESVTATGLFGLDAISAVSDSLTGDVTIATNGVLSASNVGVVGAILDTAATGNIGITTNDAINARFGINAFQVGNGTVTVNAVGPISADDNGISALSYGGDVTVTAGAVGSASDIAVEAAQLDATGAGSVSVTTTGALIGAAGIEATNAGTGNVTVASSGPITAASDDGIVAQTTTGALTVSAGAISAGGIGIYASTTGGNLSITQDGELTSVDVGIGTQADGAGAVTINRTGTGLLTSTGATGIQAYTMAGPLTITTGAISAATGDGVDAESTSGAISINVTGDVDGGGADGIIASSTSGGAITVNVTGGDVTGAVDAIQMFSSGTQTVNVSSGTVLAGNNGVYGSGSGAFTVNNNGTIGGTISAIESENVTPTTINNNATGTLNGAVNLGNEADTINNAGTWNVSGTNEFFGSVDFVNNIAGGTINFGSGTAFNDLENFTNAGLILADEGAATISGLTNFANSGTIDLQDGAIDDGLTIFGDFAGSGGSTLLLDVDDDAGDQLVISGSASGSTTIDANLIGSGILIADGVLLVDAGTSADGAFSLGGVGGGTSPLVDYSLEQRDADYFLTATVNEAGFVPVPVTQVAGEMWYQSAEAVRAQTKLPDDGTDGMKLWAQVYGSRDKAGGNDRQSIGGDGYDVDNRLDTDRLGFQVGAGFGMGMGSIGVTGGIERADAHGYAADYEASGWNLGAYGMFGGPTGVHGALLVKHDRFDVDMGGGLFGDFNPDGRSNGVDGEVGYRFGGTSGPAYGVSAGLAHVRTKIDDFSLAGLEYDYDSMASTRGRVGARVTGSGPISPFLDVRAYHEFSGDGDVRLSDGIDSYRLSADGRGTWARIEAGVGGPASGVAPMVSAWIDVGDVKGFGGRGSFRF